MTEPTAGIPPTGAPPSDTPPPGGQTELESYIRENRSRFTEDVLRRQALAAGHPSAAIEAALASTRDLAPPVDRGSVVKKVFIWYLGVYLILDVLMLINPANVQGGFLGDMRGIGILILSLTLGAAFVASLIWIASRRLFVALVGVGIALSTLSSLAGMLAYSGDPDYAAPLVAIVVSLVIVGLGVGLAVAAFRIGRTGAPASPSTQLLMVVPFLMLLAVGGTCVVSGLPIPRPV
jgi:hypothetical protein